MPPRYGHPAPSPCFSVQKEGSKHEWAFTLPCPASTPIPLFDAAADTGKFVKAILLRRDETLGKRILAATDYYTSAQIVEQFARVKPEAGRNALFIEASPEDYKMLVGSLMGVDERIQQEMLENMQLLTEFGYFGKADLKESQRVCIVVLCLRSVAFCCWL